MIATWHFLTGCTWFWGGRCMLIRKGLISRGDSKVSQAVGIRNSVSAISLVGRVRGKSQKLRFTGMKPVNGLGISPWMDRYECGGKTRDLGGSSHRSDEQAFTPHTQFQLRRSLQRLRVTCVGKFGDPPRYGPDARCVESRFPGINTLEKIKYSCYH